MAAKRWTTRNPLATLGLYLPHHVQVLVEQEDAPEVMGLLQRLDAQGLLDGPEAQVKVGEDWLFPPLTRVYPVLYALEDLPNLPAQPGRYGTRPIEYLVSKLGILFVEDRGLGETVSHVTVLQSSLNSLKLAVHTSYEGENSSGEGSEYEVLISAFGDIDWRNVTADNAQAQEVERPTPKQHWNRLNGYAVLEAFEYLVELHVAVREVAVEFQSYVPDAKTRDTLLHYVRKGIPQTVEGEQGNV